MTAEVRLRNRFMSTAVFNNLRGRASTIPLLGFPPVPETQTSIGPCVAYRCQEQRSVGLLWQHVPEVQIRHVNSIT